ncbi:two-component system response regulator [Streptococcus penaeicida]|uniref:Two-component system response regulator n=1 Tax=Streptococcus penaeicida TaxID=1765960 RepID=A0A2N8LAY6_9STRE|nr:response regulator transcription factor [Streptococcus penaeicida]PND47327.1 two-component system response regulator [Streptococcus penaeicida]
MKSIDMLVVDDEYMILEGMKRLLPYEEYGIGSVTTAENAEQALAYFREHSIDIVLTDVCMPEMSGLDMIDIMKKESPKTSFIMMSGFQEFDFVKKAISLGVADYLVKPINKNELSQLLKRIVADKKQALDLWQKVLLGQEPLSRVMSLEQDTYILADLESIKDSETVSQQINHQTVYFAFSNYLPEQKFLFVEKLQLDSHMPKIIDAIERSLFYQRQPSRVQFATNHYFEELLPLIETGQLQKVQERLMEIVQQFRKTTPPVYLSKHFFSQIMTAVYHHFHQLDHLHLEKYALSVETANTLDDLLASSLEHLTEISESKKYSSHIVEILNIINQEYQKELTLKDVSERLYLNNVYLGQIIKRETGASFAELLNRKRIKNAQQLLITTDTSIEEICFQVGYSNIGYFYKIFKRFCGESPKSYRQQLVKKSEHEE